MSKIQRIVERPIGTLKLNSRNARTHSKKQVQQLANSIKAFGFNNPILIDERDQILAGHGRVRAAESLGWANVPTLRINHLSEAEKRAYVLADNKLAEKAGWDIELLQLELGELVELDLELDLSITGFETGEIDVILANAADDTILDEPTEEDLPVTPVSQLGDLWHLGRHRLLCGDATDASTFATLLPDKDAQLVFTDPPYNLPINGHVSGLGRTRHKEFVMGSGEMTPKAFTAFLNLSLQLAANHSVDGSLHYVFIDWRHIPELLAATEDIYRETKALCVWTKSNGGMGSFYRSQHELVYVFKNGSARHRNNIELGVNGRNRTNVWTYPGANSFRNGRLEELALHPTVKPIALIADAILDASDRNGIVLDPFVGSGTTVLAAEQTGRVAAGIEIDPGYVDVAIRRWEQATGEVVRHAETGMTLDELSEHRGIGSDPAHADREQSPNA